MILAALAPFFSVPAFGATASALPDAIAGTWRIARFEAAPWVDPQHPFDDKEAKGLMNALVVFKPHKIDAPGILACDDPNYQVVTGPAESLFQGGLDEMARDNPKVDPAQLARQLGYTSDAIETLQTGCANELDFHFQNATTAQFALNNFIFTLLKKAP